jgi:hypothetical protein
MSECNRRSGWVPSPITIFVILVINNKFGK